MRRPQLLPKSAVFLTLLAMLFGLCATVQADDHALAGKWKMVSVTPDGAEVPWNLVITYADGKYTGSLATDEGTVEAKNFHADGNDISLTVPYEGNDYEIKLRFADGKLKGTWSGGGESGDTRGEKSDSSS